MVQLPTLALLVIAPLAAPAASVTRDSVREASGVVENAQAIALPSGSSQIFRERMLEWNEPAEPALRLKSTIEAPRAARLDRLIISSRFGLRSDPIQRTERHHAGIDLPDGWGSPVMATGPGVVRISGWVRGYGNLVEIEHADGVRTRYGHLSRLNVVPSERVTQGQIIGQVGSTGRSTGPHLHYEVRVNGIAVDPLRFISRTAENYKTAWGKELRATPKWVGFTDAQPGNSLPRSLIR
jgi:murein DD-endopeptidase MepM/ murein hydrolase activator NlpD